MTAQVLHGIKQKIQARTSDACAQEKQEILDELSGMYCELEDRPAYLQDHLNAMKALREDLGILWEKHFSD